MAAKGWATQANPTDELHFQNDAVSLCLLVNRRARTLRVIDFRAGPNPAKRTFVMAIAQREGVEKVYTLVERDEVATWSRLGFAREGTIGGFYKRSDAFILGAVVPPALGAPRDSQTRIAALQLTADPDDDDDDDDVPSTAAHDLAERTVVHAKKIAKELAGKALPPIKVTDLSPEEVKKALAAALKSGRALTGFEPFGRDVQRRGYVLSGRGGFELTVSRETQTCFGNAFIEMLTAPRNEVERVATCSAVRALCARLTQEEMIGVFALAPSDDVGLAAAFAMNGFRRTGLLASHILVGRERKDATLWTRKLAVPTDE